MRAMEFRGLLESLTDLTPRQRETLLGALEEGDEDLVREVLQEVSAKRACPYCGSEHVIGWGQASGLPRWRCKDCRHTFNPLTGSPLAGLRYRERWAQYAESMRRGETLQEASERCGISMNTAHRWRHRFLRNSRQSQAQLKGIAEADETLVLRSAKGQPAVRRRWGRAARKRGGKATKPGRSKENVAILVARDRNGATLDRVLRKMDTASVRPAIRNRIEPDAILCTDDLNVYKAVAADLGLQHETLSVTWGERVRGPFHIQNVNGYHSRMKNWIRRFKGVSTRYLPHYVGWFRTLDGNAHGLGPKFMLHAA